MKVFMLTFLLLNYLEALEHNDNDNKPVTINIQQPQQTQTPQSQTESETQEIFCAFKSGCIKNNKIPMLATGGSLVGLLVMLIYHFTKCS